MACRPAVRRWVCLVLVLILALVPALPLEAAHASDIADGAIVRVGVLLTPGYAEKSEDGTLSGYNVELAQTIGAYGRLDIRLVAYDSIPAMEADLTAGRLDAAMDMLHTADRDQKFLFTSNSTAQRSACLFTTEANRESFNGTLAGLDGKRVAYEAGFSALAAFNSFCQANGVQPVTVSFPDSAAAYQALDQGQVDAVLSNTDALGGYVRIYAFPLGARYIMLAKGSQALADRIDTALDRIYAVDPDFMANLHHRYITSANISYTISPAEQAWLDDHPSFTVALIKDTAPYVDGSSGILPDYYDRLAATMGVTFHYIYVDSPQEARAAVQKGQADIIGDYGGNMATAARDGLAATLEYSRQQDAEIIRSDAETVRTLAVTTATAEVLQGLPEEDADLVVCPNVEACYQAVRQGRADAFLGSHTAADWLINRHGSDGMRVLVLGDRSMGLRAAVRNDNYTLFSILDSAVAASTNDFSELSISYTTSDLRDPRVLADRIPTAYLAVAVLILAGALVIIGLFAWMVIRSQRRRIADLHGMVDHDTLTGAISRASGADLLDREVAQAGQRDVPTLFVMFDIDNFKSINDSLGHSYGDLVLKRTVRIIQHHLRLSDRLIRWGGDEFIIICPSVSDQNADVVLRKVRNCIREGDFRDDQGQAMPVTLSIGAGRCYDGETRRDVLNRIDQAMYQAKQQRDAYRMVREQ